MRYLNTYSIFEHWVDEVKPDYNRKDDILEIFYGLQDMGFKIHIFTEVCADNFEHPSKRIEFLSDTKNIYPKYRISYTGKYTRDNIDTLIEFKEEELTVLHRLKDMGFKIKMISDSQISIYHPDDLIPKSEYIDYKQIVGMGRKSKGIFTLKDVLDKLELSFNKISDMSLSDDVIIMRLNSDKYTLDNLYGFVSKAMYSARNVRVTKDIENEVIKVFLK